MGVGESPAKTELPFAIRDGGVLRFRFLLDFGLFRDLQRQRAVTTRMPLLTSRHGFEAWYLEETPAELHDRALDLIRQQTAAIGRLALRQEPEQIRFADGNANGDSINRGSAGNRAPTELRTTRFVHPTLRVQARRIAGVLLDCFGKLVLHLGRRPRPV